MRPGTWLLILLSWLGQHAFAAQPQPLRVGILPTLSARVLLTNYQPLRSYLEQELKRPVLMLTATDFRHFQHSSLAGDYDVLLTAAHLARLLQRQAGYQPLATYRATNQALLITAKDKPLHSVDELRGHNLAIFDRHALVVIQTLQWLAEQGLRAGTDYRVLLTPSHNSVAYSVQSGESVLGATSPAGLKQWPRTIRAQLQVFDRLPPTSALVWIAHPRMGAQAEQIKAALLRFPDTPEGARFFSTTAYKGLREVSDAEMRALDPYATEVDRLLRAGP